MRRARLSVAAAVAAGLIISWGLNVAGAGAAAAAPAAVAADGPAAAQTPPDPRLARFYRQPLAWHGCQLDTQDEEGRALDEAGAQCAEVTVPLDYARPGAGTTAVAISRLPADDRANRIGPMIINLGGPAIPVLGRVLDARLAMGETGARFDLIGMDPRFTGRSSPLDCGWPASLGSRSAGAGRRSFERMVALARELAQRCADRHGDLLRYASTAAIARDMDVIRAALGEPRLSFLGYSYGSYFGAVYLQLFGGHADRFVLDSAIDPADPGTHLRSDNAPQREQALREWAAWAARHDDQYHLGATADQVHATVVGIYRAAGRQPLQVGRFLVDDTVVPGLMLDPLSDDSEASQAELAEWVRVLARAAAGAAAEPTPELDGALAGMLTGAASAFHSQQTAISCADQPVPSDPEFYWRRIQASRALQPLFGPVKNNISPCAFWPGGPAQAPVRVRNGVPALIVHADGDINATAELNRAMHRALTGSRLITLEGVRTHGVYLFKQAPCVDDAVNAYLRSGVLPAGDFSCSAASTQRSAA